MPSQSKRFDKIINRLIIGGKCDEAIDLLREELKKSPHNHWIFAELSSAYYEKKQYKRALFYAERALVLEPKCPLAKWYYAGALDHIATFHHVNENYQKAYNI